MRRYVLSIVLVRPTLRYVGIAISIGIEVVMKKNTKIIASVASLLLGHSAVSAEEAAVITEVSEELPVVTTIDDRALLSDFLEQNIEFLSPRLTDKLERMILESNSRLNDHERLTNGQLDDHVGALVMID